MQDEGYQTVFVCEDSMEGILTGIYTAYESRLPLKNVELMVKTEASPRLFTRYTDVINDPVKAQKVSRTLKERLGEEHYYDFCMILTSYQERKAQGAFAVVQWVLQNRIYKSIFEHMTDDDIGHAFRCYRHANFEMMHLRGFLRFAELEGGVLYAEAEPKNNIIVYLAEHFADRLPMEHFIICDKGRDLYAVHPAGKEWFLLKGSSEEEKISEATLSDAEIYYQELFCRFCESLSIKERRNLNLQRNMLPIRFRPYMTEFKHHGK